MTFYRMDKRYTVAFFDDLLRIAGKEIAERFYNKLYEDVKSFDWRTLEGDVLIEHAHELISNDIGHSPAIEMILFYMKGDYSCILNRADDYEIYELIRVDAL